MQYRVDDRVRVRVGSPPGHFRTPAYIQGKTGRVEAVCGAFRNPESLAHGGDGLPMQPLYRIEFFPGRPLEPNILARLRTSCLWMFTSIGWNRPSLGTGDIP